MCAHTLFGKIIKAMIQNTFDLKASTSYCRPEVEQIILKSENNFLESGQLGNVGEGDPGADEWFN